MKKINYILLTTLLFCSQVISYAQEYSGQKEEIGKILTNSKQFSKAYMAKDFETLANFYTKDAKILPPGANIIKGRKAIKNRWMLPENVQILHHISTPTEIKVIENYAYDVGYYEGKTLQSDGTEVSWRGKYVIIWKKIENNWLMYLDIWNKIE